MTDAAQPLPISLRVKLLCKQCQTVCACAETESARCDELLATFCARSDKPVISKCPSAPYNLHVRAVRSTSVRASDDRSKTA